MEIGLTSDGMRVYVYRAQTLHSCTVLYKVFIFWHPLIQHDVNK